MKTQEKPYFAAKKALRVRGKVEPGALIKKAKTLTKEELAVRGLV